jgi:uncharacterized protein (DUF305 family)
MPRAATPNLPRASFLAAFLVATHVAGCSQAPPSPAASPPPAPVVGPDGRSAAEIEAIYRDRVARARTGFTEADVRFMRDMIHHHAQAIAISRLAPTHGAGPELQTLAARIINAQRDEIATMQRWLEARGMAAPQLVVTPEGVEVRDPPAGHADAAHGAHGDPGAHGHDPDMPGMLSPEQLAELDAARDSRFETRFLELMIQHHQGAVTMVRRLFATDGAAQDEDVFRFASDVQVDQATEVARMERMLAARTETPEPPQRPGSFLSPSEVRP